MTIHLLALWLGPGAGVGAQAAAAADKPDQVVQLRPVGVVPGQYIVVFHDDVADPQVLARDLAQQHRFALRHTYEFA